MKEINETIKLIYKKRDKQKFLVQKQHTNVIMIHDTKGQGRLLPY